MRTPNKLPWRVLVAFGLILAGGAVYAAASGDSPLHEQVVHQATPSAEAPPASPRSPCELPARVARPKWVPTDLPLPPGAYPYRALGPAGGYHRALFAAPQNLRSVALFLLSRWPAAGYALGRGDSEADEIETGFSKGPAIGAVKARSVDCEPGYTTMLLVYAAHRSAATGPEPSIGSKGSPLVPSPAG